MRSSEVAHVLVRGELHVWVQEHVVSSITHTATQVTSIWLRTVITFSMPRVRPRPLRLCVFLRKLGPVLHRLLKISIVNSHWWVMRLVVGRWSDHFLESKLFTVINLRDISPLHAPSVRVWLEPFAHPKNGKLLRFKIEGFEALDFKLFDLLSLYWYSFTFKLETIKGHKITFDRLLWISVPQIVQLWLIFALDFLNFSQAVSGRYDRAGLLQVAHSIFRLTQIAYPQLILPISQLNRHQVRLLLNHSNIWILQYSHLRSIQRNR